MATFFRDNSLLLLLTAVLLLAAGCRPEVQTAQEVEPGHWFKPTSAAVISSPLAHDFDGDGVREICVGSWDGFCYLLDQRLTDRPGWPQYVRRGYFSSPALADLDRDGVPEIIIGSDAGKLFAWSAGGAPASGFPVTLRSRIWATPAILPDGRIAVGDQEQLVVLQADGRPAAGWPRQIRGWPDATVACAPGLLAVVSLTPGRETGGWLHAFRDNGEPLAGFPVELERDSDSSPALADLDGDGQWWIIFGDDDGWLHVVDTAGRQRPGFPVRTLGGRNDLPPSPASDGGTIHSIEASPAVADIDGDGRLDIAVGAWDGRMYIWDRDGQSLPGWPVAVKDQIISSAALVDLDGDERLDIVVGSKDHQLYGWTATGDPLPGFPRDLGDFVFSSPWVGDLEGNGLADIVVGANNGIHLLADVGPLGRLAWPMFHRNVRRTGEVVE
jgi:hypothetical protein